jgi:uncharacterized protein YfaP (DUF2135 family)
MAICQNCGAWSETQYCPRCGVQIVQQAQPGYQQQPPYQQPAGYQQPAPGYDHASGGYQQPPAYQQQYAQPQGQYAQQPAYQPQPAYVQPQPSYPSQAYHPHPKPSGGPSPILIIAVIAVVAVVVIAAVGAFLLFGGGLPDGGGDGDGAFDVEPGDDIIDTGSFTTAVANTLSTAGGAIGVTSSSNPLDGFNLQIPAGALSEAVSFTVKSADVTDVEGLPDGAKIVSKMIQITAAGSQAWNEVRMLDAPALVTMPYDDSLVTEEEAVRFYRYDSVTQTLSSTGYIGQDAAANTITFAISTFSNFTAIELVMDYFEGQNVSIGYDTGFRPKSDGFFIPNQGSYQNVGGNCLGMAAFAKWYHRWQKPANGAGLYDRYREGDRSEWRDDATAIQLATRASITTTWQLNIPSMSRINSASREAGVSLIHGLVVSGEPQVVGLYLQYRNGNWNQSSHAILAYKYANGVFETYDPNDPGTAMGTSGKQIPFTYTNGFTEVYKSGLTASKPLQFNWFYHAGDKVFIPDSALRGLYESAEKKFEGDSTFPTVELTDSDSTGQTPVDTDSDGVRDTASNKVTITGTISGGQQPVTSTLIFVANQKFRTAVDSSGAFSQLVPLYPGMNDVIILATDWNTVSNWAGYLKDNIMCTASPAALTVTLTWGESDSDVDLHVQEPTLGGVEGRHIYYSNKGSDSNAPYLDFDNTAGYGPEHYYATEGMSLPNSVDLYGTYEIRVHYYADHDTNTEETQPITWTVHISYLAYKNDQTGDEIWEEATVTGYLGTANSYSSGSFDASDSSWSNTYQVIYKAPNPSDYGIPAPPATVFP